MAHVTLIRPPAVSTRGAYSVGVVPPLGLAYVAAALEQAGHEVVAIDALGETPLQRQAGSHPRLTTWGLSTAEIVARVPRNTEFIGVSVMFSQQWPEVDSLIRALGPVFPDRAIVVGGEHATAAWEFVLATNEFVRYCVLGEGEETIVELVQTACGDRSVRRSLLHSPTAVDRVHGIALRDREGRPGRTPARARLRDADQLPRPAWHLFPLTNYLELGLGHGVNRGRSLPMLATRGCPFRCTFCSSPNMWTTRYYMRDPKCVVDEIADYVAEYRVENIDFADLTMVLNRRWILEFCEELCRRALGITFQLPSGTRSEVLDEEVLRALQASGCRNITYAPESGSRRTLARIRKKVEPTKLLESMRIASQLGIRIKANLMIGFPDESRRDLLETVAFGARAAWTGVDDIPLFPLCPYPGSELYDELVERGALPPLDNDFLAELGYMDLTEFSASVSELSATELKIVQLVGMASFYLISYGRRPQRLLRTARNLLAQRSETVLEQRLVELLRRRAAREPRSFAVDIEPPQTA